MKIQWKFADGTTSEVEVNEELGAFITASRREEDNLSRKERYHCYSLDAILFEGKEYGDYNTPESEYLQKIESESVKKAFLTLTPLQQRRLAMYSTGMSYREIAKAEGTMFRSVEESIKAAKKKFKKNF